MCRIHLILGKENISIVELNENLFERLSYNYLQLKTILIPLRINSYFTFIIYLKAPKMSPWSNKPIGIIVEINVYKVQYCQAIFQWDRFPGLDRLCLHSGWIYLFFKTHCNCSSFLPLATLEKIKITFITWRVILEVQEWGPKR